MLNLIELMDEATEMIRQWKGDKYVFGFGVIEEIGRLTRQTLEAAFFGNFNMIPQMDTGKGS